MPLRKIKPPKLSPTFEKIIQDRLRKCEETTQSASKAIATSKRLTKESRELVEIIREQRKKR